MTTTAPAAPRPKRAKTCPTEGSHVIWPTGVEKRYGISAVTRWRWEKDGRLPPRDVCIGGKTGWRPATLEAAETRQAA